MDNDSTHKQEKVRNWLKRNKRVKLHFMLTRSSWLNAEAAYRNTYVCGNFFRHVGSQTKVGSLVHYGWDNDPTLARKGKLHLYHNTVSIREDRRNSWRFRLFDMRQSWNGDFSKEVAEAFNNIVYVASETAGEEPAYFCMSNDSGTVNLGVNWMTNSWDSQEARSECYPYANQGEQPTVNGAENLIDTSGAPRPIAPGSLASNTGLWNSQGILCPSCAHSAHYTCPMMGRHGVLACLRISFIFRLSLHGCIFYPAALPGIKYNPAPCAICSFSYY